MVKPVAEKELREWGTTLADGKAPLCDRFRALFGLRHAAEPLALDLMVAGFNSPSDLLKHELAYCLGQKGDKKAVPVLISILENEQNAIVVRHEAGEALAAIGDERARDVLKKYSTNPQQELAETCTLGVARLDWLAHPDSGILTCPTHDTVDPAPPMKDHSLEELKAILVDVKKPLFERFRAMFTLRNKGTLVSDEKQKVAAVEVLAAGLVSPDSALFRHEVAYVLGQMAHPSSVPYLSARLIDPKEHPIVRHESAEALGNIAAPECMDLLKKYLADAEPLVKESCVVALDVADYLTSDQFQYAAIPAMS